MDTLVIKYHADVKKERKEDHENGVEWNAKKIQGIVYMRSQQCAKPNG